eukprot:763600-Hanusia_phi.AAC.10
MEHSPARSSIKQLPHRLSLPPHGASLLQPLDDGLGQERSQGGDEGADGRGVADDGLPVGVHLDHPPQLQDGEQENFPAQLMQSPRVLKQGVSDEGRYCPQVARDAGGEEGLNRLLEHPSRDRLLLLCQRDLVRELRRQHAQPDLLPNPRHPQPAQPLPVLSKSRRHETPVFALGREEAGECCQDGQLNGSVRHVAVDRLPLSDRSHDRLQKEGEDTADAFRLVPVHVARDKLPTDVACSDGDGGGGCPVERSLDDRVDLSLKLLQQRRIIVHVRILGGGEHADGYL